jgi:glutathione S-transferase
VKKSVVRSGIENKKGDFMKLFFSPGACSMSVHIALQETGIGYDTAPVDLKTHKWSGGDYFKINPKGYVPALQLDNGEILTEVAVVLQYVADQKPEARLIPQAGTLERYRCQEWLNFISAEIHKGFGPLWDPSSLAAVKEGAINKLNKKFEILAKHLATRDYLMGQQYTVADSYLFTILNWSNFLNVDLTAFPPLLGFMERVKTRPATFAVMKTEGLLK